MIIEHWEREDLGNKKTIWTHTSGVKIFLTPVGPGFYQLILYDRSGVEHYRSEPNYNRTKLEQMSAKWQRDYNKHIKRESKSLTVSDNKLN